MIFYEKKSSTMATNSIAKNFKKGWKNNSPQKNHKIWKIFPSEKIGVDFEEKYITTTRLKPKKPSGIKK